MSECRIRQAEEGWTKKAAEKKAAVEKAIGRGSA
jgi:hypothetical protein